MGNLWNGAKRIAHLLYGDERIAPLLYLHLALRLCLQRLRLDLRLRPGLFLLPFSIFPQSEGFLCFLFFGHVRVFRIPELLVICEGRER